PDRAYGRADWDLIFRAFVDVGKTVQSDRLGFENDDDLIGTGLGLEFQLSRNFSARMDWAIALQEASNLDVKVGSNRFHFIFTVLY
ncbi:MAG: hypothetical protein AAF747_08685, partial [Planctomycetota bacterium]